MQSSGQNPPATIHVDLDGAAEIYKSHGWDYPYADDPLFESGLTNALALFERHGIRATLFVIAASLDDPRKRALVQEAIGRGHDVGSHSLTHVNLLHVSGEQKRREIAESRKRIESTLGVRVSGFRAPGYQINRECIEYLAQSGYEYDASAFPTSTFSARLATPVATLTSPHRPIAGSALLELPLPDHRPSPFPFNPSYSLLFGMPYFRWGLNRARRRGTPLVMLFHLTDLAEPLPRERLNGLLSRIFTLSDLSGMTKVAKCQKMIELIGERFRIVSTNALIADWEAGQQGGESAHLA